MRSIHYALILIVLIGLVYAETPRLQFLDWDDNVNVYANPLLNPNAPSSSTRSNCRLIF